VLLNSTSLSLISSPQRRHPALVDIGAVALHAGIENFADRLDHGVGQSHMKIAAAAFELDMESGYHHHLGVG